MDQLHGGERAVLVHGLHPAAQLLRVLVVPEPAFAVRGGAGAWMDAALLRADDGPSAFGLHAPMRDIAVVLAIAHRVAVRHLIEAVLGDLRADLDRREQDVVTGIAGH